MNIEIYRAILILWGPVNGRNIADNIFKGISFISDSLKFSSGQF